MKIVAKDGREFDTVEACQKYEAKLEKFAKDKVKENLEKLLDSNLAITKVVRYDNQGNETCFTYYMVLTKKKGENRKALLNALVEKRLGRRYTITFDNEDDFIQHYSFSKLSAEETEEIKATIIKFLLNDFENPSDRYKSLKNIIFYNFMKEEVDEILGLCQEEESEADSKDGDNTVNEKSCCKNNNNDDISPLMFVDLLRFLLSQSLKSKIKFYIIR